MTRVALLERIQMGGHGRNHADPTIKAEQRVLLERAALLRAALHAANNVSCSFGDGAGGAGAPKDPVAVERDWAQLEGAWGGSTLVLRCLHPTNSYYTYVT